MAAKKSTGTSRKARSTEVRNSPIPKKVSAPKSKGAAAAASVSAPIARAAAVTEEMIARRAYEIAQSGTGSGDLDNWLRAERELRGV